MTIQTLLILPALLQAAVLTLLSASIPLAVTLTSVLLAITSDQNSRSIVRNPSPLQFHNADSVHVLAFTSHSELLVAESVGSFSIEDWGDVYEVGKSLCCDGANAADDDVMQDGGLDGKSGDMMMFVKSILKSKVDSDLHWKD